MVSKDFMKRFVRRAMRGQGSLNVPNYMMYFGDGSTSRGYRTSGIGADEAPVDSLAKRGSEFDARFGTKGNGVPVSGSTMFVEPNNDSTVLRRINGIDLEIGMKQTVTTNNLYMNYNADAELLQSQPSVVYSATPVDSSFKTDWMPMPSRLPSILDLSIKADVTGDLRCSADAADWISERFAVSTMYGADMPGWNVYRTSLTGNYEHGQYSFPEMVVFTSELKYDPEKLGLRFLGNVFGGIGGYSAFVYGLKPDPELLKIQMGTETPASSYYQNLFDQAMRPNMNPGCYVVALRGYRGWYMPVLTQAKGAVDKTRVYGPQVKTLASEGGMNSFGFNAVTTDISVSSTCMDYKTKHAVTILKGDAPGRCEYYVERFLGEVIENNLTSHLPELDPDGNKIPYFSNRSRWARTFASRYTGLEERGVLAPVMFPASQAKDDEWLYYVSMDEELNFWLNRQRLGYANRSECLMALDASPIQVESHNSKLWMVWSNRIMMRDNVTGSVKTWTCGGSLPNVVLTAIAIDETTNQVWFGHLDGVFQFDNGTVSALNLASWPAKARKVARQGLSASNGYLAWSAYEYMDSNGTYTFYEPQIACWWDTNSGRGRAFVWNDLFPMYCVSPTSLYNGMTNTIGRVAVRSNGDFVVTHSPQSHYDTSTVGIIGMSVFRIDADSHPRPVMNVRHWIPFGPLNMNPGNRFYLLPLKMVNDTKIVGGAIHVPNALESGSEHPNRAPIGDWVANFSMILEVTLDDNKGLIHSHPDVESAVIAQGSEQGVNPYSSIGPYDRVNFPGVRHTPADVLVSGTLATLIDYACLSLTVIRLKDTFTLTFCGRQYLPCGGVSMTWDNGNWRPLKARERHICRKADGSAQAISSDTTVTFDMTKTFASMSSYGFVTMPSTEDVADLSIYLGDFIIDTEEVKVEGASTPLKCQSVDAFYAIDVTQTQTFSCKLNGANLAWTTSSNPSSTEYSVTKTGQLLLSTDHVGATATVTYNYVAQAG